MGIHRQQRIRPQQFEGIEPQSLGGDDHTLQKRILELDSGTPGIIVQPVTAYEQTNDQQRRHLYQIPPHDAPVPPPHPQQQDRRQGDGDGLAQHGGGITRRQRHRLRHPIEMRREIIGRAGFRLLPDTQPATKSQQVELGGQEILAGGDPHHRLGMNRMQGEQGGDEPRGGQPHPSKQMPHQQGVGGMKHKIGGMEGGGPEPPQFVIQPEGGVEHRPVMKFVGAHRPEPDIQQAAPLTNLRRLKDEHLVIPNETGGECGRIGRHGHQQQSRRRQYLR